MKTRSALSAMVLAGSGFLAFGAHAAEPAQTGAPAAPDAQGEAPAVSLEEIVVTARRRGESLEDVPQTVSAVTQSDVQQLNLLNLQDLSGVVPGLQIAVVGSGYNNNDTLRGVTFNPAGGSQNTVAFYVNDIPVTNALVSTSNFDVGQIEVLSGPQGTLRGEPAPSGSLTVTTHKPDLEEFGGYATVTGATHGNTNENAAVNLPIITDKLAVRLAAVADDSDFNGVRSINSSLDPYSHTYGGRVSIRFEPIDSIEANVVYQQMDIQQGYFDQVTGSGAPGRVDPDAPANYNGPAIGALQRLGVEPYPNIVDTKTNLITGSVDWHVAGQVVSYDAGYFNYALNVPFNDPANQAPGITAANPIPLAPGVPPGPTTQQFEQTDELRVASESPLFGFMDYTGGVFFRNTRAEVNSPQLADFLPGSFGSPSGAADPNIYNPKYTLELLIQTPGESKELSEFAHFTFHMPGSTELAVGVRYLHYENDGYVAGTLQTAGTYIATPLPFPCSVAGYGSTYPGTCDIPASTAITDTTALARTSENLDAHTAIYNMSLSHKFADGFLAYISSASSWRPPSGSVGISNGANDPTLASLLHVKAETSYDFETGIKWTFLENRGRLNLAFYHQQFDNFIYYGLPVTYLAYNGVQASPTPFNFTTNPNAVVNGVDFDTGFLITRQWSVKLAGSYANGHLTGGDVPCNPPGGGTTAAAFPPGKYVFLCPSHASTSTSPNFNATAQSEYDFPLARLQNVDAFVRGLYVFYGRNPNANEFYTVPAYGLFNLYMGLRNSKGNWEAALFAKNLFDTQKLLSIGYPTSTLVGLQSTFGPSGYSPVGSTQQGLTPQQEFGLTLTYSFGSK